MYDTTEEKIGNAVYLGITNQKGQEKFVEGTETQPLEVKFRIPLLKLRLFVFRASKIMGNSFDRHK